MEIKDLKLFAGYYVGLQENLTSKEKMSLLEFIMEANAEQVKCLLLTGEQNKIQESGEVEFINEVFEATPVGTILSELPIKQAIQDPNAFYYQHGMKALRKLAARWADYKVGSTKVLGVRMAGKEWDKAFGSAQHAVHGGAALGVVVAVALVGLLARKAYKAYLTKAARACKGKKGIEKNECIRKFKADAIQHQIKVLSSSKDICKATKSPEKCIKKVDARINSQKAALQKIMTKKKPR